ncbi:MAG: T9SS type A sorting domain-containing protein [Saprospiraceae bacterium]|nr:T9SS type A sorting domain-containing protein [Saprospiraceae bacterium]
MKSLYFIFVIVLMTLKTVYAQNLKIDNSLISGGGSDMSNSSISLKGSVGQPVINVVQNGSVIAHQGFWYVATYNNGQNTRTENPVAGIDQFTIFPNPASYEGKIQIRSKEKVHILLEIQNINGQKAGVIYNGETSIGENIYHVDVSDFPTGEYFISLTTDGRSIAKKIIVVK